MRSRLAILLVAVTSLLVLALGSATPSQAADGCEYVLGFKALHDLIPDKVGPCRTSEHHNLINGDGLQETAGVDGKGGLLVWRKADNWTAYTDGYRTWINGPLGLQQRLNTERFPWETSAPPEPKPGEIRWSLHEDSERSFKYPSGWTFRSRVSGGLGHNYYDSPDGKAYIYYVDPMWTGAGFDRPWDHLTMQLKAWDSRLDFNWGPQEKTTIAGHLAGLQWYEFPRGDEHGVWPANRGVAAAIQSGQRTHLIDGRADSEHFAKYEPILLEAIRSYVPK